MPRYALLMFDPSNQDPSRAQGPAEAPEQFMRRQEAESRLKRAEEEAKKAALSRRVAIVSAVAIVVLVIFTYAMWRRRQQAEFHRAWKRMGQQHRL